MNGKLELLSSRLDQLSSRVGRLSEQLATETAASRLSRWASRHPPRSDFVRQLAEGNTGRCGSSSGSHSGTTSSSTSSKH